MPNITGPQTQSMILMIAFIAVMYFVLIRPQRQQDKKRREMLNALNPGDKIITVGGIYGEITEVRKNSIRVRVAKDVILRMSKASIQGKTSKDQDD